VRSPFGINYFDNQSDVRTLETEPHTFRRGIDTRRNAGDRENARRVKNPITANAVPPAGGEKRKKKRGVEQMGSVPSDALDSERNTENTGGKSGLFEERVRTIDEATTNRESLEKPRIHHKSHNPDDHREGDETRAEVR